MAGAGAKPFVDNKIRQRKIILFTKKHDPLCKVIRQMLDEFKLHHTNYEVAEIDSRQDCTQIENYFQIICLTDSRSVPHLFAGGKYIGGEKEIKRLHTSGQLKDVLTAAGGFRLEGK